MRASMVAFLLVIATSNLVAFAASHSARACSYAERLIETPAEGAHIPGNLLFFRVLSSDPAVQFELLDADTGEPIPASIVASAGEHVLMPDASVAPGTRVALLEKPVDRPPVRHEFTAVEHVELRLRPAALKVIDHQGDRVTVRYQPPDATGSAAHLLRIEATIDGAPLPWERVDSEDPYTFAIHASCDGIVTEICGVPQAVPEGSHLLEVEAHVIGSAEQPAPVQARIETVCPLSCRLGARNGVPGLSLLLPLCALLARRRPLAARRRAAGGAADRP